MGGCIRRRLQRARLPLLGALKIARRFGENFLHDTRRLGFVLAARLDLDGRSHRRTKGQNAQDIPGIGHTPAAAEKDNGPRFPDRRHKTGGHRCGDTGMGGDDNACELHTTKIQTLGWPAAFKRSTPLQENSSDRTLKIQREACCLHFTPNFPVMA